jgi:hypothetical protein
VGTVPATVALGTARKHRHIDLMWYLGEVIEVAAVNVPG